MCESSQSGIIPLEGWNKEEKFYLLQALKLYGSHNIKSIQQDIPTKSEDEIKLAIARYKKEATNAIIKKNTHITMQPTTSKNKEDATPKVPLASWAQFMIDSFGFDAIQTETAAAIRLIADFEPRPLVECTENVDFKKIYHIVANALEGKPLPDDEAAALVIHKCLTEAALLGKPIARNFTPHLVKNKVDFIDKELSIFCRPTKDFESGILMFLAAQRCYNPLNLEEDVIKFT